MSKRNREVENDERPMPGKRESRRADYTVGWVCALPKEQTAATAMLDQTHPSLHKPPNDHNTYTLGSIGKHNVVIACLPKGKIGTNSAATVATQMIDTFPSIKVGLMVGIGGGVLSKVRLGDVVVSTPVDQYPGVVQWDFGKAEKDNNFKRIGALNNPPNALLTALAKLETQHEMNGPKIPEYLDELKQKWPRLAPKYLRSDSLEDVRFKADHGHVSESTTVTADDDDEDEGEENCQFCDRTKTVKRKARGMRVHYGLIASGNQVIKDATIRDKLNNDLGGQVLCVEMEAAGLMDNFPCIVIRGICDYADSHKNKDWQEHAAAVAAAFAKELLEYVQPSDVEGERTAKDALSQVSDVVSRTRVDVAQIKSMMDGDEGLNILNWLTPIDYGPQQSDFIKRRQEGTGTWLLRTNEFTTWLDQRNKTLFCSGIPGAGKTILAAIVVDHLNNQYAGDPTISIAYIYCNFRQQNKQKAEDLLLSLLKQFVQGQPALPKSVKTLYRCHNTKKTRPSYKEIEEALLSVVTDNLRAFIVIDALDECGSDIQRNQFLLSIFNLQAKTRANIFATSRIRDKIEKLFKTALSLQIRANEEDVESYLDSQMSLLPSDNLDDDLRNQIRRQVVNAVDGMFLLAQLHMNTVMVQPTKGHIKEALHHMAKGIEGLDDTYKQAMERIKDQGKPTRELANRILGWIIHAKGPLSTTELQHALAVRFRTESLDTDYIPSVHVLRSVCAGLVTVDEKSGIVRLAHYTTQEYLERTQIQWFPNAETEITTTCVTYLSFSVFETGFCQSDAEFEKRLRSNPLYDYAAHNWGHHARKALTLPQKVVDFLECEAKVEASIQALMAIQPHSSYSKPFPRRMTGLHLAAYFGVAGAVEALLHKGVEIDAKNSDNQTPLWWAALNGHEAVVKLLLITGKVDVDPKDWCGQTPLSQAAKNGHEAVVKLLLITGKVDVNCKDRDGWTPLSRAAANGYEAAVKQLLANDSINPNSKDNSGWTPLWLALENEHEAVVKLLLAKDSIDPNLPNHRGQTILWWAIEKATSLLYPEDSKNLKLDDNGGWIPFPVKVLNLLLTIGNVDIKSKDAYGQTLLSWAAAMGQGAIVKVLLSKDGIDPASTNNGWRTPLSLAAERGHEPVVKMLLAIHKVDPDCKDKSGRTPLSRAAESGHENIIRLLLATERVNWDAKDSNGRTPLFYAAAYGQQAVVTLLLKKGSNADLKDNASRTPLSWAAANGHKAVVKLLQSHSNPS